MEFPINVDHVEEFAEQLRTEGFDAKADLVDGQLGVDVGPRGLDTNRLPPDEIGLFLPLWELNDPGNRPLVVARRFHDICENRPPGWELHGRHRSAPGTTA